MPPPSLAITGIAVDFTANRDGAQINIAVAATGTEPAYVLGIPMNVDMACAMGGQLLAIAGALKAAPPSPIVAARGLAVVASNGTA